MNREFRSRVCNDRLYWVYCKPKDVFRCRGGQGSGKNSAYTQCSHTSQQQIWANA